MLDLPGAIVEELATQRDDELSRVIEQAHFLLLKHPFAARAAFRAVVAEGRRYGATEEGAPLKTRLQSSELVRRGRSVWEIATGGMLNESPEVLPTQFVDLLCYAVTLDDLEPALARAVEPMIEPDEEDLSMDRVLAP